MKRTEMRADETAPEQREPAPGTYARVVGGIVAEEPVSLPDSPEVFFPADLPGVWVRLDEGSDVHCHCVQKEDGSFSAPGEVAPPPAQSPMDRLTALLRDNPDLIGQLEQLAEPGQRPVREKSR